MINLSHMLFHPHEQLLKQCSQCHWHKMMNKPTRWQSVPKSVYQSRCHPRETERHPSSHDSRFIYWPLDPVGKCVHLLWSKRQEPHYGMLMRCWRNNKRCIRYFWRFTVSVLLFWNLERAACFDTVLVSPSFITKFPPLWLL